jgi:hypothetical protein
MCTFKGIQVGVIPLFLGAGCLPSSFARDRRLNLGERHELVDWPGGDIGH